MRGLPVLKDKSHSRGEGKMGPHASLLFQVAHNGPMKGRFGAHFLLLPSRWQHALRGPCKIWGQSELRLPEKREDFGTLLRFCVIDDESPSSPL